MAYGPIPISTWVYRLAPVGSGTEVTEEFTNREPRVFAMVINRVMRVASRADLNRVNMEATLAAIANEVES